jgi:L-ascorbate metabolism protein UlaG (beta-lactamase superfamily)
VFSPAKVREDRLRARRTYGGRNWPSSFADRLTAPLPGFTDVARMLLTRRTPAPAVVPQEPATALPSLHDGQTSVTWVGHATFVLRIGGLTVLTDPVWSNRIPGVRPRLAPPGIPLDAVGHVDAVVISHNHYDHLDAPTIRRLDRDTPMLVPGMLGAFFRQRNFRNVIEMDWWESVTIGGVDFGFTPSHHWSRRSLADTCETLWGGWVLRTDSRCIYFAGDTGYGHWFTEIASHFPGIDVALLPIGAYEPNWFMRPVHMKPAEAVRACGDLGARRMVPMHWGTFVLSSEPTLEPPALTLDAWRDAGHDRDDLWDLAIGATRVF